MSFANPWGLLLLLSLLPLLVLHFLARQRRRVRVPALVFWRRALGENRKPLSAGKNFDTLNLLLRILLIVLVSLGFAGLSVQREGLVWASKTVFVLDGGASMKVKSGGEELFTLAKNRLKEELAGMPPGKEAAVLLATAQARLVSGFSPDPAEILRKVDSLLVTEEAVDWDLSFALAESLSGQGQDGSVVVFSGLEPEPTRNRNLAYRFFGVPEGKGGTAARRLRNVALTGLSGRARQDDPFSFEILAGIKNFSDREESFPFEVSLDGLSYYREELVLGPGNEKKILLPYDGPPARKVEATLDIRDDFPLDNRAYAAFGRTADFRVRLVSLGNRALESFFAAYPGIDLRVSRSYSEGDRESADLTVIDTLDVDRLGRGNFLLVNTYEKGGPLLFQGEGGEAVLSAWDQKSPLLNHLDPQDFSADSVLNLRPRQNMAPFVHEGVVYSRGTPILGRYSGEGRRVVYLAFDPEESLLTDTGKLAVLLSNILGESFSLGREDALSFSTGDNPLVKVDSGLSAVELRYPDARREEVPAQNGFVRLRDTRFAGWYELAGLDSTLLLAFNALDPRESARAAGLKAEPGNLSTVPNAESSTVPSAEGGAGTTSTVPMGEAGNSSTVPNAGTGGKREFSSVSLDAWLYALAALLLLFETIRGRRRERKE